MFFSKPPDLTVGRLFFNTFCIDITGWFSYFWEMKKLPEAVSHPQLCEAIVGQFAFMKAMSKPSDNNSDALYDIDLNDVFQKCDDYFVNLTSFEEIIETEESNLENKITEFLSQWKTVVDVTAIQQNVHNILKNE